MEKEMLSKALRFKTNFVTPAETVLMTYCAYKDTWKSLDTQEYAKRQIVLDKVLQESLFRSYICLLGKYHNCVHKKHIKKLWTKKYLSNFKS